MNVENFQSGKKLPMIYLAAKYQNTKSCNKYIGLELTSQFPFRDKQGGPYKTLG